MLTPDITTLWVVGFLLLCTYLLNTLVFQPILSVIDKRTTAVRGARELADSAAQKATAAATEYDNKLNTARAEVYRQMDDMRKTALDKRADLLASTRATVEQELKTATAQVQQESTEARAALDRDASNLAGAIVSRVLGPGLLRATEGAESSGMMHLLNGACELKRKLATAFVAASLLMFAVPAIAQEHAPAKPVDAHAPATTAPAATAPASPTTAPAAPPAAEHAQPAGDHAQPGGEHAAEGEHHDESIGGMILAMGWPVANFIIFIGVLYYYLNQPLKDYLAGRSATIRKDLVEAAELRSTATAQLATIEQKLQALPGELVALRTRGAEDIKAEEQRIAAAAVADRERLLEQTRREIDLQVRLAKKAILEHAADLSVQLATEKIKNEVTPEDQSRLVDRYLDQVKKS